MNRKFTESTPNIIAGTKPVSSSGLIASGESQRQRRMAAEQSRLNSAKEFDLAQQMTGQKFQAESDAMYKDIVNNHQLNLQRAIMEFGEMSPQAQRMREVYNNKIATYQSFNKTGTELQAAFDSVPTLLEKTPFANSIQYKGAIYDKIKNGDLIERYQNGEFASTEDMLAEAMMLDGETAGSVYDRSAISSGIGAVVGEMDEQIADINSQLINKEDGGYIINQKQYKYLREFVEMDGNKPVMNPDGTIKLRIDDQSINKMFNKVDPNGNMKRAFEHAYENEAEEGESRTDFFKRYTEFEEMMPASFKQTYKEQMPASWEKRYATENDYYALDNRVTRLQKLIDSTGKTTEQAMADFEQAKADIGFFVDGVNWTDVNLIRGEQMPEVTDDDFEEWKQSEGATIAALNEGFSEDDFSDFEEKVDNNQDAYLDQVLKWKTSDRKGNLKDKYKDRVVFQRKRDGEVQREVEIDMTAPDSHQKIASLYMESSERYDRLKYLKYTDPTRYKEETSSFDLGGLDNLND